MQTRQQLFNTAYHGLAAQGFERSTGGVSHLNRCLYRGGEGRRCALGYIISDEVYRADMEHLRPIRLFSEYPKEMTACGLDPADTDFLMDLQDVHDEGTTPAIMQSMLRSFATEHNLTIPELPFEIRAGGETVDARPGAPATVSEELAASAHAGSSPALLTKSEKECCG